MTEAITWGDLRLSFYIFAVICGLALIGKHAIVQDRRDGAFVFEKVGDHEMEDVEG